MIKNNRIQNNPFKKIGNVKKWLERSLGWNKSYFLVYPLLSVQVVVHDKRPVKKINKKKEAWEHKPGHHLELNKQIFKKCQW